MPLRDGWTQERNEILSACSGARAKDCSGRWIARSHIRSCGGATVDPGDDDNRWRLCDSEAVTAIDAARPAGSRSVSLRWSVHLFLIASAVISLVLEPILTLHVIVGLMFVGFVVVHLVQRRKTSAKLLRRLTNRRGLIRRPGRLAIADALLFVVTAGMLASGLWDWAIGHPTRIRWHAVTGVLLVAYLVVHTLRRRTRLRRSQVR
jgi:hypothetical protein